MRSAIKNKIDAVRQGKSGSAKAVTPVMLMSSPVVLEALKDVHEGNSLTIKDVQEKLHCGKTKALELFRGEPGVSKIGKSYIIPQSVFDRVVRRGLIQ